MKENLENLKSLEGIPNSKVGLSLSFCIRDIMEGKIKEEEVKEILSGTNAGTSEQLEDVLGLYKKIYWTGYPEEAAALARRLFAAGKIKQPITEGARPHNIVDGYWLDAKTAEEEYKKRLR